MKLTIAFLVIFVLTVVMSALAWSGDMSQNDVTKVNCADSRWFDSLTRATDASPQDVPFSFTYNGKPSSAWLASCRFERSTKQLDENRKQHTLIFTDTATGLVLTCVAVEYLDFRTVEWTLYFKNSGSVDTPIIENIQALDLRIEKKPVADDEYVLHHNNGTLVTTINVPAGIQDYEPLTTALTPGKKMAFIPPQGRPCAGEWPYYNLAWKGGGAIIVVGWPGAWAASFTRDDSNGLDVKAGQQHTHFKLHPQEELRSPLVVVQRYTGDWIGAQNTWRRWMFTHNIPRPGGKLPEPMTGGFTGYYFPDLSITQQGENQAIDRYKQERLLPDSWWVDAGWYEMTDDKGVNSYTYTGTWETDMKRFPGGLNAVFSHARENGIGKGILWFEPERVAPSRWLYEQRPQWLLGREGQYKLLNMGNPEALEWVTNMVDRTLNEAGITIYREDFNFGPLDCWTYNEPEDRQGVNEIKHVTGHLAFWKELLRRNPNRMIDTCASGGHRLDLETLRLSVPLWRTDYPWEPIGQQGQTYGLSMWVPYHGTGVVSDDPYIMRSDMAPFFLMSWDMNRKDIDFNRLRKLMAEWKKISKYYSGDFYPLSEYSVSNTVWMAWQYNRPDVNGGLVQLFRRAECPYISASYKLKGLDAKAQYRVVNLETGRSITVSGAVLMAEGITGSITSKPRAVNYIYTKVDAK
ncbi:MAG: alpha-galactosidase [Armatimonadota bacterium]